MQSCYSDLSLDHLRRIAAPMTPAEMIKFLQEGAVFRTFPEVLRSVYPDDDLTERLTRELTGITGKDEASVARKLRNWMNGSSAPQNREQLFQICFALGLGEEAADRLLACADDAGIHYRNPDELVYAFALRTGRTYHEAQELRLKMRRVCDPGLRKERDNREISPRYTRQLWSEFADVNTIGELEEFFRSHGEEIGKIHESAYRKFAEMLDYLQEPEKGQGRYSLKQVTDQYLRMHIPNTKASGSFSYLQRAVKRNWPGERELLRIKSRSADVGRKTLLLLFLVTDEFEISETPESGSLEQYEDLYCGDIPESPADRLEMRLMRLNLFLDYYGMNLLDPRNPFDCLLLYALGAQCGEEGLSEKFAETLEILFGEKEE